MNTMSIPTLPLPYGYVTGRFLLVVGDTTRDDDRFPDPLPALGTVVLTPLSPRHVLQSPPATAIAQPVTLGVDEDGYLVDPTGAPGVWVVAGQYDVTFRLQGVVYPSFRIAVTESNTIANPLDLTLAAPLTPTPDVRFVVNEQVYRDALAARDTAAEQSDSANLSADAAKLSADSAATDAATATSERKAAETARQGADGAAGAAATSQAAAKSAADDAQAARAEVYVPVAAREDLAGSKTLPQDQTRGTYLRRRLTGNAIVTLGAGVPNAAYSCSLELTQDATGGRTLALANVATPYGVPIPLSPAANAVDLIRLEWNGARWSAFLGGAQLAIPTAWVV